MKKVSIALFFLVASFTFTSCDNRDENGATDSNNTDVTKNATDSTRGDKQDSTITNTPPPSQESIDFANKAAIGGLMEVQAGNLAQQNAKSQRVKNFGSMMITDHTQANEELKSLAAANNITLPATLPADAQKHIAMMSKMKGDAFDKHYMDMMVNDHKKNIDEFNKEANSTTNDAFKGFAAKTLPTLQKHLDSANAIHGKK